MLPPGKSRHLFVLGRYCQYQVEGGLGVGGGSWNPYILNHWKTPMTPRPRYSVPDAFSGVMENERLSILTHTFPIQTTSTHTWGFSTEMPQSW